MEKLMEAIREERLVLSSLYQYLNHLLYAARLEVQEGLGTLAAVDRTLRVRFSPKAQGLPRKELQGLLMHELWHPFTGMVPGEERWETMLKVASAHGLKGEAAHRLANAASDLAINSALRRLGLALPKDGLFPDRFGLPEGLTGEEYLLELLKVAERVMEEVSRRGKEEEGERDQRGAPNGATSPHEEGEEGGQGTPPEKNEAPGKGEGGGQGSLEDLVRGILAGEGGGMDEAVAAPEGEEGPLLEAIRREVAQRILEAAKRRGNVPGDLIRFAEEVLASKVPWEALLRALVSQALAPVRGPVHRTYAVLHRRTPFLGAILPGGRDGLPRIALVVDTSGSMGDRELEQALAEVRRILALVGTLTVYSVDAAVQGVQTVRDARQVHLKGGGGTDMRVGIEEALKGRPDLIVVYTDGHTPWPEKAPPVPVVVVCTTDERTPPWAKRVRVEV
jgi:predicted metal-dependent peptidase